MSPCEIVVDKMALGHIHQQVLWNSPVDTVPPRLQIIYIYMLLYQLLTNGQTAEAWEPPERNALSGVGRH